MIKYRIAFIGNENSIYSKAKQYFNEKNENTNNFEIELTDVSKLSKNDIESIHFHCIIYNINETKEAEKDSILKILLDTKSKISDLKIFPLTKSEVTKDKANMEEKHLLKLTEKFEQKDIQAIPINISNEQDLQSVFDAIKISSIEYKTLAEDVLDNHQKEFEMTANALINAIQKKSPYTASHLKQVGLYAEKIAQYMGKDEQEIRKVKSIALLHDAGKLLMPIELLESPHMTVGNERTQMELHSKLGNTVIAKDLFNMEEKGGISEHHNFGTLNKYAKVIAVADCLDTMTSQRAYNNPKAIHEVFRDLARNMEDKKFIGKDGKEIVLPAQFDRETAIATIIMLDNELKSIGYNAKKMIKSTSNNNSKNQDEELYEILKEYSEDTMTKTSKDKYTSLGFKLTRTGHLEFKDRPISLPNKKIRVKSEYEFLIFKNSTEEQRKNAKSLMDLEANFNVEEREQFKRMARLIIVSEDEMGKIAVQAGRKIRKSRAKQVVEVAKLDKDFNENGVKDFIQKISNTQNLGIDKGKEKSREE